MAIQILLFLLGSFIFLFTFWKRLKEDYFENQIFTVGIYAFLLLSIANIISFYTVPDYWFWFSFVGVLLGIIIGSWRFNMRFYEVLEGAILSLFIPMNLFLIYDAFRLQKPSSFFAIAGVCILSGLYYLLHTHYKTFSWYRSGRVGFAGLATAGIFFLVRALVAIWFPTMVSFVNYDFLISGSISFLSFLFLANLTLKKS